MQLDIYVAWVLLMPDRRRSSGPMPMNHAEKSVEQKIAAVIHKVARKKTDPGLDISFMLA